MEWIVDISWSLEILMNFVTADKLNRTLKRIAINYLQFWFWFDIAATLPGIVTLQSQQWAYAFKLLRLLHFKKLFDPIDLTINYCLRNKMKYKIHKVYSLCVLVTSVLLIAHWFACAWIYLGMLSEDSWINAQKTAASTPDGQIVSETYGMSETYILSLYWICTVLTTVGYGDFSGSTDEELLFSIFLESGGLFLFSILTGLLI